MSLVEFLQGAAAKLEFRKPRHSLALSQAVQKILRAYGPVRQEVEDQDLEVQLLNFEQRLADGDWDGYPWSKASSLLRSLFQSERLNDPRWAEVLDVLLRTLSSADKSSFLRTGLDIYLCADGETSAAHERLATELQRHDPGALRRHIPLLGMVDIFQPDAQRDLARVLGDCIDPYCQLQRWGIQAPHMPGLIARAFEDMMDAQADVREAMDRDAFDRIMAWLPHPPHTLPDHSRAAILNALLLPIAEKPSEVPEDLEEALRSRILSLMPDPRIFPEKWDGVEDEAVGLVRRWLTGRSLSMFFQVINIFEEHPRWDSRRQFWTEINDFGMIDDAWVILNKEAHAEAARLANLHQESAFLDHGEVSGNTCFFMMKIGRLLVIEGTHTFSVRVFEEGCKYAPKFKKSYYTGDSIRIPTRRCAFSTPHHAHDDGWKVRTREYLRRHK